MSVTAKYTTVRLITGRWGTLNTDDNTIVQSTEGPSTSQLQTIQDQITKRLNKRAAGLAEQKYQRLLRNRLIAGRGTDAEYCEHGDQEYRPTPRPFPGLDTL